MTRKLTAALFGVSLVIAPLGAGAKTVLETLTLAGGEKKVFTIEAAAKTKVGFEPKLSYEERKKCQNECIQLSQKGGISVASSLGSAARLMPQGGKITFTITNVEDHPIEVEVWHQ